MKTVSLRQKWVDLGIVFLLKPDGKDVTLEAPYGILTQDLIAEIKQYKAKIIEWLQKQKTSDFKEEASVVHTDISFTEEAKKMNAGSQIEPCSLSDLSSEDITRTRFLLEASYSNPTHDAWHGDGIPQKFRDRVHTFAEMETALERFIHRLQTEDSHVMDRMDGAGGILHLPTLPCGSLEQAALVSSESLPATEASEPKDSTSKKANTATQNFIKAQEALPEYQDYERQQKLLDQAPNNTQLKGACTLARDALLKACESLPEWKPFLEAKEWLYLNGVREEEERPEDKSLKLPSPQLTQRIALLEQEKRLPFLWAEAFALLLERSKPLRIPEKRWRQIIDRTHILLNQEHAYLLKIIEYGWGIEEVFGCHKVAPDVRIDGMGLLMLLSTVSIAEIKPRGAFLKYKDGAITTYALGMINCAPAEQSTLMTIQ